MMRTLFFLLLSIYICAMNAQDYRPRPLVWTTPSANSSGSMPCGGHDIGMNVWVEGGELLVYLCQSGWFDEANTLLKAGRLRLNVGDETLMGSDFKQSLVLDDGSVVVSAGDLRLQLWADTEQPIVYLTIAGKQKRDVTLSYESWRYRDRQVPKDASQQNSYKWLITDDCITYADSVVPSLHSLTVSHVNRSETVFDLTVARERLESVKDKLYNPVGGREMRAVLSCADLAFAGTHRDTYINTDYQAWDYKGSVKETTVTVQLTTSDHKSIARIPTAKASRRQSAQWWHSFWNRSYIYQPNRTAEPELTDTAGVIIRNYELFRYMLGCNARGVWPSKFNGGLFTFDPVFVATERTFTPDYRCWGGGTMTAQNQRLVYWHTIKGGDEDMLRVQLDTYKRMLGNARLRTQVYWGHDGASYTEQIENFGLPNPAEYGKHKEGQDIGVESNAWLEYLWDTSLEFCQMALEAHRYINMDITEYEEMVTQCLVFFDEHYQYQARKMGKKALTEDGKLIIYPGSGAETYKMAYNPSSTVAALQVVAESMRDYLKERGDTAGASAMQALRERVPDLPLTTIDGDTAVAPAVVWARIQNVETPQMYAVYPWRILGVGRPHLEWAKTTWNKDAWAIKMRSSRGWKQDNIWAACIGDTEEAVRLNYEKMANGPYRFPAFYDMGFDWAPDLNRGGAGLIGIQEMLMQRLPDGTRVEKPAWPERFGEVVYKLH